MAVAIPASDVVSVIPTVLAAGGQALDLSGLMLTDGNRVPLGQVLVFSNAADVTAYFGANATESDLAAVYFLGFANSQMKPGHLLVSQYNTGVVGAWMRGGSLASLTLTQLQALTSGTITISLDGTPVTSGIVNLSTATSFSDAAELITVALGTTGPVGAGDFQGTIDDGSGGSGTVLVVTGTPDAPIVVGQELIGASVTAGTLVSAQVDGTSGGNGTYTVSISQLVAVAENMTTNYPTCTYDSVARAFRFVSPTTGADSSITAATASALSTVLRLTEARGAVTSQGAIAATPAGSLSHIVDVSQDWATFFTTFDPDAGSGFAAKLEFADWTNDQNNRYGYIAWDTDSGALTNGNDQTFGFTLDDGNYSGICPVYSPGQGATLAAFISGTAASIDFSRTNGRHTFKFRRQGGILPDITSQTDAAALRSNFYNFYGVWATANDRFTFAAEGSISGDFRWLDSFINQIWMSNSFQLNLMNMMLNTPTIPYNREGYAFILAAMQDTINQAVNFGAIRSGVPLSEFQKAWCTNQAGVDVSAVIFRQGYFAQVKDATAEVRQARGSPPVLFLYTDGGSVHRVNLQTVAIL